MLNKRIIPVGSYILRVVHDIFQLCQVVEVLRDDRISVVIIRQSPINDDCQIGKIYTFPLSDFQGQPCFKNDLRRFGFADSDEKGWQLVYWFGIDMKLLFRHDKSSHLSRFRFKSDYRKSYVSITCRYFHELQNIMRFLTGGELEFEYRNIESYGSRE